MSKTGENSAQPCGCDIGANHICEWHSSHGLKPRTNASFDTPRDEKVLVNHAQEEAERVKHQTVQIDRRTGHPAIRTFDTGATRNQEANKPDYEGYLSPQVIEAFGRYMTKHRVQEDGSIRASDNWQKGIPRSVYIKSIWRHFMEVWIAHRDEGPCYVGDFRERLTESLCALMFNVMGYLHEHLRGR